jgi:hypothetical protein
MPLNPLAPKYPPGAEPSKPQKKNKPTRNADPGLLGHWAQRGIAAASDTAAGALHRAGKKVAGERGGRVGDVVANAALGAIRAACNTSCTHKGGCDHS